MNNIEKLPVTIGIRNMQRQLCAEECLTRKRKREGFSSAKELLFEHILNVLRQIRGKFQNSSGIQNSRHLHDFHGI